MTQTTSGQLRGTETYNAESLTLGIDPALGVTGYGLVRQSGSVLEVVDAGVIRCRRDRRLEDRLSELSDGVSEVLAEYRPDSFAVEELYSHYDRPKTAILMGHARGVILLAAAKAGLQVFSYAATQIKKTLTGNGRAPKSQMQFAVQHQLGLKQLPEPADVADALAIAVTHCHVIHSPARYESRGFVQLRFACREPAAIVDGSKVF